MDSFDRRRRRSRLRVVVSVVAKLLQGDEISKLLDDRGKKVKRRSQGRRDERRVYREEESGPEKGEALIIAIHFLVQGISSVAVVVVDE